MKAYRYNSKRREDRKFNRTGREKNPNNVKFYATSLKNAESYKEVYMNSGELDYVCDLEVVEIEANLFDMESGFESLEVYKLRKEENYNQMLNGYKEALNNAKTKKEKGYMIKAIEGLNDHSSYFSSQVKRTHFQMLSDFHYQDILIKELKEKGFNGYICEKEIALF